MEANRRFFYGRYPGNIHTKLFNYPSVFWKLGALGGFPHPWGAKQEGEDLKKWRKRIWKFHFLLVTEHTNRIQNNSNDFLTWKILVWGGGVIHPPARGNVRSEIRKKRDSTVQLAMWYNVYTPNFNKTGYYLQRKKWWKRVVGTNFRKTKK